MHLSKIVDVSGRRGEILASVEAYDKDHAISRLKEEFPEVNSMDWDFIVELEPLHFVGVMGYDFPLFKSLKRPH